MIPFKIGIVEKIGIGNVMNDFKTQGINRT
jgi:hypothetical protein